MEKGFFKEAVREAKTEAVRDFRSALKNWVTTLFGLGLLCYALWTLFLSEYRDGLDSDRAIRSVLFSLFGLFLLGAKDQEAYDLIRRVFLDMFGYWLSGRRRFPDGSIRSVNVLHNDAPFKALHNDENDEFDRDGVNDSSVNDSSVDGSGK